MFRFKTISWCVLCALSAAGCANWSERNSVPLRIEPSAGMGHASASSAYQAGRYHHGQLNYDRAIAAYREALQLDPSLVDARNGLAIVFAGLGRHEEAIRELQAAVAIAPHAAYLRNNLGYIHMLRGGLQEAVAQFEEARRIDPANGKAQENLKAAHARMAVTMESAESKSPKAPAGTNSEQRTESAASPQNPDRGKASGIVSISRQVYELRPTVIPVTPVTPPPAFTVPPEKVTSHTGTAVSKPATPMQALIESHQAAGRLPNDRNAVESRQAPETAAQAQRSVETFVAQIREVAYGHAASVGAGMAAGPLNGPNQPTAALAPVLRQAGEASPVNTALLSKRVFRLEVSNGNGVNRLAKAVSARLRDMGVTTARLTNHVRFDQAATEVQYLPGYEGEAAKLVRHLKVAVPTVETKRLVGGVHVRLVLGKDAPSVTALMRSNPPVQSVSIAAARTPR